MAAFVSVTAAVITFSVVPAGVAFSMVPAGVAFSMIPAGMAFSMVAAVGAGIDQFAPKVSLHRLVGIAGCSRTQFNAPLGKSCLRTAAYPSADQHINIMAAQQSRKSSMAASAGSDHFALHNLVIPDIIDFEFFRVPKMLKDVSVFVSNCYSLHSAFLSCQLTSVSLQPGTHRRSGNTDIVCRYDP
jgi:hypothetical protein